MKGGNFPRKSHHPAALRKMKIAPDTREMHTSNCGLQNEPNEPFVVRTGLQTCSHRTHDAPQNSCVTGAQNVRHDFFAFHNLHRTHTGPLSAAQPTVAAPVSQAAPAPP